MNAIPILRHSLNQTNRILVATAQLFDLQPDDLRRRTNIPQIVLPRQIAMYIIRGRLKLSYPMIGRMFNRKHHTTVLHSVEKIEKLRQTDADIETAVKLIEEASR